MRALSTIDTVIMHHSATSRPTVTIEQIDDWHHQRGFRRKDAARARHRHHLQSVGYHFVITLDGKAHPGRDLTEIGAHCKGHNTNSVGICLIGDGRYTVNNAQLAALRRLLMNLEEELQVAAHDEGASRRPLRLERIVGHRDLAPGSTVCPGFNVADWLTEQDS